MKYSELKRRLKDSGCCKTREGTNHEIWFSPITNDSFPVGRHDGEEVKAGTLQNILKKSGLKLK